MADNHSGSVEEVAPAAVLGQEDSTINTCVVGQRSR